MNILVHIYLHGCIWKTKIYPKITNKMVEMQDFDQYIVRVVKPKLGISLEKKNERINSSKNLATDKRN